MLVRAMKVNTWDENGNLLIAGNNYHQFVIDGHSMRDQIELLLGFKLDTLEFNGRKFVGIKDGVKRVQIIV